VLKASSLLGHAYKPVLREVIGHQAPWEDFLEFFQTILMKLDSLGLGLVLMIDEFHRLQKGIDDNVTSPQILENIRYLIQAYPRFVTIMAAQPWGTVPHEHWPAPYDFVERIDVAALDSESAKRLVTDPVQGRLIYTDEAIDLITHITACQPRLIQFLGNRIFKLAAHHKTNSVNRNMVEEAARSFVQDNEYFATLWQSAKTDRRRFLIALCHKISDGPDPVTFEILQDRLAAEKIELTDAELDHDLKFLQELKLIDFTGTGGAGVYRLTVPLMGQWIDQQLEYAALRSKAAIEQKTRT
jgi:type I restriction enzyme M protein